MRRIVDSGCALVNYHTTEVPSYDPGELGTVMMMIMIMMMMIMMMMKSKAFSTRNFKGSFLTSVGT